MKIVGELPKLQFAKCKGEEPYVTKVAEEANTARIRGTREFTETYVAPKTKILARQEAGIAQYDAGPLDEGPYNQCSADKATIDGQAKAFRTRVAAEAALARLANPLKASITSISISLNREAFG